MPSKVLALGTIKSHSWDNVMTKLMFKQAGPRKVCALVTTKNKVYIDPIGVECRLWPLWCPQRNLDSSFKAEIIKLLYNIF